MRVPEREIELGMIAAHMHDIGNAIARLNHPMHGAAMAFTLLNEWMSGIRLYELEDALDLDANFWDHA
jgi:metal-dependent HD superfamily phosphatase/phosphodiesterase